MIKAHPHHRQGLQDLFVIRLKSFL